MTRESLVSGDRSTPLIEETIGAYLDRVAQRNGSQLALVVPHQRVRWTYSDLKTRSDQFAAGLLRLGLKPGDRVGIWSPNCAEWTVAQFATAKAGLVLVNINPAYRIGELEHVLRSVECRALITASRFKSSDYLAMLNTLAPELADDKDALTSAMLPTLRHVITIGSSSHRGCMAFVPSRACRRDLLAAARAGRPSDRPAPRSASSSRAARPACRRARRCLTTTHQQRLLRRRGHGIRPGRGCAFQFRCITASAW